MQRYNPKEIEPKWQKQWEDTKAYEVHDDAPGKKFYQLIEFPYPSGVGLHVGHCRPYITFDVMSRWRRMNGENVLYPIGWDAFGLPAEQYAIKTGVHPAETTKTNIDNFRKQAKSLGLSFDWSREFSTADPKYYKWTQWICLQLFKHGLAYQAESQIWWCEDLKSVLADEEVINGRSERGDYPCERRSLRQWMLAITKYADRLYDDLDTVDYIEPVKIQQRNWIGRKDGINVTYEVVDANKKAEITCFTTRPDTNYGATFIVLAPEHPFIQQVIDQEIIPTKGPSHWQAVQHYVQKALHKSELQRQEEGRLKTGAFTGLYVENKLNGKKLPVWVSDFVLAGFGTGAVVGVPGHDTRDFEFAKEFNIPVERVVVGEDGDTSPITTTEQVQEKAGVMVNSGPLDGLDIHEATEKIKDLMEANGMGKRIKTYNLRDWVFSRQRYWGEPFPIVWVKSSDTRTMYGEVAKWLPETAVTKTVDGIEYSALPIPSQFLPLELPDVQDFQPKGLGQGPLAEAEDWVHVWYNLETGETKPLKDGKPENGQWVEGSRETDTMPNWAGSSWYFLRYIDPHNDQILADKGKIEQWMPVNWYNGGMEHTTLHLLYSRFWHKFLFDIGVVNTPEPYQKRTSHGLVLSEDGRKMSKSWGNVVDPLEVIQSYGADTLRLYICFMGPFEQTVAWNVSGVAGCRRFIDRFWVLAHEFLSSPAEGQKDDKRLTQVVARANQRITGDVPRLGFNTAVAALMEAVNEFYKLKNDIPFAGAHDAWAQALSDFTLLLAPFIPHTAEELWHELGHDDLALQTRWPTYDESLLVSDQMTIAIQINGKIRAEVTVDRDASKDDIIAATTAHERVRPYLEGKEIKKTIYVPGKLVSFVV